jgi:hypothetical protein
MSLLFCVLEKDAANLGAGLRSLAGLFEARRDRCADSAAALRAAAQRAPPASPSSCLPPASASSLASPAPLPGRFGGGFGFGYGCRADGASAGAGAAAALPPLGGGGAGELPLSPSSWASPQAFAAAEALGAEGASAGAQATALEALGQGLEEFLPVETKTRTREDTHAPVFFCVCVHAHCLETPKRVQAAHQNA